MKTQKLTIAILLIIGFNLIGCKNSTKKKTIVLKETVPLDLKLNATPKEAAEFAWQTFLAINEPDSSSLGTKWENYKEAFDIFLPNADKPAPWGISTPFNESDCEIASGSKILRTTSKVSPIINETNQAVGGVLIDRNSNLVHYEVYMNKPMFEYVLNNEFYNAVTQAGSKIDFPTGSMELKAAWRILDPKLDDIKRYHTAKAIIYIPDSTSVSLNDCLPSTVNSKMKICSEKLVGLVGLHIVYKTPSNPSFTWMTFEQVDNVKDSKKNHTLPSFNNPATAVKYCPENSRQCDCPDQGTSQITRENPIPDWVKKANTSKRDSLKQINSVWQHYKLIGIQWARDTTRIGNPLLTNLANTSMETYNQTASSCIGCHAFARSSNPKILSDFSWVMGRAQNPSPQLPDTNKADLLKYVMRVNPYKTWGTWPDDSWNIFSEATPGENPHGNSVRIYVNDMALNYYDSIKNTPPSKPILPLGSIVLKENYRTILNDTITSPSPSDLVELTIMYKAKNSNGGAEWFWMKTPPYGPVEIAGFNETQCSSCHMNWKGNGDGLLSFNFGKRPVITERPYQKTNNNTIKKVNSFIENLSDK